MVLQEPLDLQYWFINVFSGSMEIFSIVGFIAIAGLAAYFRMNTIAFLMLYLLFVLFTAIVSPSINFIFLAVLIGGLILYYILSKFYAR